MSNRTKIGTDATNRTVPDRTKIGANPVPRHTEIGVNPIPQLTEIGAVLNRTKIGAIPDRTKIGADHIRTITKSSGITTRILHARANRTSRVPIRRVFNDKVIQLAIAIKAI